MHLKTVPKRRKNKRKSKDYSDNNFINNDQYTKESPGDLGRFAVTQTPVRNHLQTLVYKSRNGVNSIINTPNYQKKDTKVGITSWKR